MTINPDNIVFWQWGVISLNATIVFTWLVMALLTLVSWLVTRRLSTGTQLSRWQNLLEVLVSGIRKQIREGASPRHVPAKIVPVADIPRTKSGKITELAVRDMVHGREVKNKEALANPEALELFKDLETLRDLSLIHI